MKSLISKLYLLCLFVVMNLQTQALYAQPNLLSEAISKGHYTTAAELAKSKTWLEIKSGQLLWNPLYFAIFQAGVDSNTYLKIYAKSKEKVLPSYGAHKSGFLTLCKFLIDSGIQMNSFDKKGRSPLYYACVFRLDELVHYMVEKKLTIEDSEDLFKLASSMGYLPIVQQMLKYKLNPCDPGRECFAPIHLAAMNGHTEILSEMLKYGANKECETSQYYAEFSGLSPLQLSILNGQFEVANFLITQGCKTDKLTQNKENLIHLASKGPRTMEFRLNKKGEVTDYVSVRGSNSKLAKHIDSLLPNLYGPDDEGITPLHWAAYYKNIDLCRYYISRKHAPIDLSKDADHCFASALSYSLNICSFEKISPGSDLSKITELWKRSEKKYSDSLQKIQNKIVGRKLLQVGFIVIATAAAQYQASIDASSTGYGYSSVEYPLIETGDLLSIKKYINRQVKICEELSNYFSTLNENTSCVDIYNKINKSLIYEY